MDKSRDFEEVISGNVNLHVVDILDNLRTELSSTGVLTRKIGKKELITVVDELIDALPVELRTARWIVREQQSFLSKARHAPAAVASCPIERCIVPCRRPRENISSSASSNNLISIIIR